jgi:hypothetical protein
MFSRLDELGGCQGLDPYLAPGASCSKRLEWRTAKFPSFQRARSCCSP